MVKKPPAPCLEIGDHVFFQHPARGPISGRVTACGRDGFRAVCDKGEKHAVPHTGFLGHKARTDQEFKVVDEGADGAIVESAAGRRRWLAGGAPAPKPTKKLVTAKDDDPLLGNLKDLAMKSMAFPEGQVLFLKAGIANRPGLALVEITSKSGQRVKRWKLNHSASSDKPTMKHGDNVDFRHGDVQGTGKIVASGKDGVTVRTPDGQHHQVRHENLTGPAKEAPAKEDMASAGATQPEQPDETFSADAYRGEHDEAGATPESILAQFPPEARDRIDEVEADLKHITQTIDIHKKGDSYTPERQEKHREIINKFLSPEKIAAAMPPEGQKPTFMILGGRGGSGKGKFAGLVYDEKKAIVLDADKIKAMLPEYEGWNAAEVHEESGDLFDAITEAAYHAGLNIVHDATMKSSGKPEALIKKFKESGYRVEAHYMHVPRQEAARRAVDRFISGGKDGRYVPPSVILANKKNEGNFDSIKNSVDAWSFRDNSGGQDDAPKLIAEKKDDRNIGRSLRDGLPADPGAAGNGRVSTGAPQKDSGSRPGATGGSTGGGFPRGFQGAYGPAHDMEKALGSRRVIFMTNPRPAE